MRAAIGVVMAGSVAGWFAGPRAALADDAPAGDQEIEPRDATRGGVNGPALPVQRGRESPLSMIDERRATPGPHGALRRRRD